MSETNPEPYRALDGRGERTPTIHIEPADSEAESEAAMIEAGVLCPDGLPNKVVPLRQNRTADLLAPEPRWLGDKQFLEIDGLERPLYDSHRGVFVVPPGLAKGEMAALVLVLMAERR